MRRRVVVQGDVAGGGVEMDGGDDEVREADDVGCFGEEGQEGDVFARWVVVGLVVQDHTGLLRFGRWEGRHVVIRILGG